MALQIPELKSIFKHSSAVDAGGGKERIGQSTVIVALDGTGDTDNIQEGIDLLPITGGVVFIKEGTYNITEEILISYDNIALQGTGYGTKIETNTAGIKLIKCVGADYTTIRDIQLDGNSVSAAIIWLETSDNCIVEGCFIHHGNNAIYQWGTSHNNSIINNKIDTFTISAIELNSGGDRTIIIGNTITGAGLYGMWIASGDYCVINGNNISGCTRSAIFGSTSYSAIIGNVCTGNTTYGIELDSGDKNIITNNILYDNTTAGYLNSGTNTQIGHNITS